MWICVVVCNEWIVIVVFNVIDCELCQWMVVVLISINLKVFGQFDWLVEFFVGVDVVGQLLMEDLVEYYCYLLQEVDVLMVYFGLLFVDVVCLNLLCLFVLLECDDDVG